MIIFNKDSRKCYKFLKEVDYTYWDFIIDNNPNSLITYKDLGVIIYINILSEKQQGVIEYLMRDIPSYGLRTVSNGLSFIEFTKESKMREFFYGSNNRLKYEENESDACKNIIQNTNWKYWYKEDDWEYVELYYEGKTNDQKKEIDKVMSITYPLNNVKYSTDPLSGIFKITFLNKGLDIIQGEKIKIKIDYKDYKLREALIDQSMETSMMYLVEDYPQKKGFIF